jgi:hypothetical protein
MAGSIGAIETTGTRETFEQPFGFTDLETGDAIDLADVSAIVFDIIDPDTLATLLTATIGSGVTLEEDADGAVFTVRFESASMDIAAKTYDVRCVITKDGNDIELFGTLPVVS